MTLPVTALWTVIPVILFMYILCHLYYTQLAPGYWITLNILSATFQKVVIMVTVHGLDLHM